jgi:RimJ/RimL family protein N-acetyltransferase
MVFRDGFTAQPHLEGQDLLVRPLAASDLDGLFVAASDPEVWAGHPAKNRHERVVFEPYFKALLDSGSAVALVVRGSDRVIGCSRYYVAPDMPDSVSIGFTFLARDCWGGDVNFEVKRLMLGHAFEWYDAVWFHIAPSNIRSQRATSKLGAQEIYRSVLNLGGADAEWLCFELARRDWDHVCAARLAAGVAG